MVNIIISGNINTNCFSSRTTSTSINATKSSFTLNASASASGSGANLSEVLKNVFQSLIDAVTKNVKPDLNPNEKGPVYTIIDSSINLVVNFFDSNNNQTIVPIVFNISTKNLLSVGNSSIIAPNNPEDLSATSTSISGTLGQLLLLLIKQIPTLSESLENVNAKR